MSAANIGRFQSSWLDLTESVGPANLEYHYPSGVVRMATVPQPGRPGLGRKVADDRLVGNSLLSNTTACEASRLLLPPMNESEQRFYDSTETVFRIYDLMSLLDSVVLHEQIFYLPASLPHDVAELELRNRLVESGALEPLPRDDDHNTIGKALLASLSTVEGPRTVVGDPVPLSFQNFRSQLIDELRLTTDNDQPGTRSARLDDGFDPGLHAPLVPATWATSFDEAARDLISAMDYGFSGSYEGSVASLRAMYYVFASEHYGLPYLPSASVKGVVRRFPNYFHPSVTEKLYQQLAMALRTTIDKVAYEFDGTIVFVPPFSALILDRASTLTAIPSETLAMREDYKSFRSRLRELEYERLEARSLNDRQKFLRQIERLGKEIVRSFDKPSQMKLESALRYIPDAVEIAANPTNPGGWAQLLLHMPIDALVRWYRRRPVAKLVSSARTVSALPDYDRLLTKHFGEAVASHIQMIQSEH